MSLSENIHRKDKADYFRYRFLMNKLTQHYVKGMTAIDVGCDDGTFIRGVAKIGYVVSSIDLVPRDFTWPHYVIDIEKESLGLQFDVILVCEILEHLEEPDIAMQNVLSMCHSKSLVIISVPNFDAAGHLRTYKMDSLDKFARQYIHVKTRKIFTGKSKIKRKSKWKPRQHLVVGIARK